MSKNLISSNDRVVLSVYEVVLSNIGTSCPHINGVEGAAVC